MRQFKPWEQGPFELLLHAEEHYLAGNDHDRRIALIGYDESIEVSITVYLSLKPIHRNGREYSREDVEKWMRNYHTKLAFYYDELKRRDIKEIIPMENIVWFHDHRNEHYHGGTKGVPERSTLDAIRSAAIWVFSTLFEVPNVETMLVSELRKRKNPKPQREAAVDKAIDDKFGLVNVAGSLYYTSEVLYALDPDAYLELGQTLISSNLEERTNE